MSPRFPLVVSPQLAVLLSEPLLQVLGRSCSRFLLTLLGKESVGQSAAERFPCSEPMAWRGIRPSKQTGSGEQSTPEKLVHNWHQEA